MTASDVIALVIAAALALLGVRSLVTWLRSRFAAGSARELVLYALHVTARVGLWFAFAALFAGLALLDDPSSFRWFVLVPIALAGIQLLTALALGRSPSGADPSG